MAKTLRELMAEKNKTSQLDAWSQMLMPDLGAAFELPQPVQQAQHAQQGKIRISRETLGPNYSEENFARSLIGFEVARPSGPLQEQEEEADPGTVKGYDKNTRMYQIDWDWGEEEMSPAELQPLLLPKREYALEMLPVRKMDEWETNVMVDPQTLPSAAPLSKPSPRKRQREPAQPTKPAFEGGDGWEAEDITSMDFQWFHYAEHDDESDTEEDRLAMDGPEDEGGSKALEVDRLNPRGFQRWWDQQKKRWVMVRDTRAYLKAAKEDGEEVMRYRWTPFEMFCSEQREKKLKAENVDAVDGVNDEPAPGWHKEVIWRKDGTKGDAYYYAPDGTRLRSVPEIKRYLSGGSAEGETEDYDSIDLNLFTFKVANGDQYKFKKAPNDLVDRMKARAKQVKQEIKEAWEALDDEGKRVYEEKASRYMVPTRSSRADVHGPRLGSRGKDYSEDVLIFNDNHTEKEIEEVAEQYAAAEEKVRQYKREKAEEAKLKARLIAEAAELRKPANKRKAFKREMEINSEAGERFYEAKDDETPHKIAQRFDLSVASLIATNVGWYPQLSRHARLRGGTLLILPAVQRLSDDLEGGAVNLPRRMKVWWPMDRKWYFGTVDGYNQTSDEAIIIYDDGEVENINLGKEKWEAVVDSPATKGKGPQRDLAPVEAQNPGDETLFYTEAEAEALEVGAKLQVADPKGQWATGKVVAKNAEAISIKWTQWPKEPLETVFFGDASNRLSKCKTAEEAFQNAQFVKEARKVAKKAEEDERKAAKNAQQLAKKQKGWHEACAMFYSSGEAKELKEGDKLVVADDQGRWASGVVQSTENKHIFVKLVRWPRDPPITVPYEEANTRLCKCASPEEAMKQAQTVAKGEKQGWKREDAPAPARVSGGVSGGLAAILARASSSSANVLNSSKTNAKTGEAAPVKTDSPAPAEPTGRRTGRVRKAAETFVPTMASDQRGGVRLN